MPRGLLQALRQRQVSLLQMRHVTICAMTGRDLAGRPSLSNVSSRRATRVQSVQDVLDLVCSVGSGCMFPEPEHAPASCA